MSQAKQSAIRQNLFWIVGLVLCVVLLIASALGFIGAGPESIQTESGSKKQTSLRGGVEEKYTRRLSTPPRMPKTPEEEAQGWIEEYQDKANDLNTPEEERPDYLLACGNLNRVNLKDSATAKNYYERIILEFPKYPRLSQAYRGLYACYKDIGDEENARWVCNEALKKFDKESMDYQWAQIQLGLIPDPRVEQGSIKPQESPQEILEPLPENPLVAPTPDPNQLAQ